VHRLNSLFQRLLARSHLHRSLHALIGIAFSLVLCSLPHCASAQDSGASSPSRSNLPDAPSGQPLAQSSAGFIHGVIVDPDGDFISNAHITLTHPVSDAANGLSPSQPSYEIVSSDDGGFTFSDVPSGPFELTVSAPLFAARQINGELHSGESYEVPEISLVSAVSIETQVTASVEEVAQAQIRDEEKQRVLGFIPNFYVSYVPDAAPLTSQQKVELGWKTLIDPVSFLATGFVAGVQQSTNAYPGYGQGALGYSKRFAASYGNMLTSTIVGGVILPVALKQDPRYFYKADGSVSDRIWYAVKTAVICKGDNGHWQFNYSGVGGSLASGFISNAYYPAANRNGGAVTLENTAWGTIGSVASNLFQEFLIPRFTPHKPPVALKRSSVENHP
jgi:hypothetical protein